jgi:ubiquinone/menaquinone biosynthesis C-methylase UbiE
MIPKLNTYWEDLAKSGPFNMHQTEHRNKAVDLLKEYNVTSVLDVGCGSGPNYKMIKDKGIEIKYKGTDVTHGFIEMSRKMFPEAEWDIQDIRDLKEKDNSWDCTMVVHVLDHVRDYEKAISELCRVSSRLVILDIWRPFTTTMATQVIDRNDWAGDWEETWLVTFNREHLESIFKKLGMEIVYTENFPNEPHDHHSFIYVLRKI